MGVTSPVHLFVIMALGAKIKTPLTDHNLRLGICVVAILSPHLIKSDSIYLQNCWKVLETDVASYHNF